MELRNIIASQRPDLLHTTLFFSNLMGRIAGRSVGTPIVTTLANQEYGRERRANSRYGSWSVRAVHAADVVTAPLTTRFDAISDDVASVMSSRLRVPRDRIQVVYRGRDPARLGVPTPERRLRTRAALSLDVKAPLVLSVGRLDRQKGVETTIDAFRRVCARIPGAVLLVAGRAGNADAVVQAEARCTPAVRLLGRRTDVPGPHVCCGCLVIPITLGGSRWHTY